MTQPAFKPLCKDDIADVLGVSIRTVENWVDEGRIPRPTRLGHRVYWHPTLFFEWLSQYLMVGGATSNDCEPRAARPEEDVPVKKDSVKSAKEARSSAERELAKLQAQARASVAFEES